jgi:hypothetical protein
VVDHDGAIEGQAGVELDPVGARFGRENEG